MRKGTKRYTGKSMLVAKHITIIDGQTDGIFIYYKDDTYICITPYEQEQLYKMIPVTFEVVA